MSADTDRIAWWATRARTAERKRAEAEAVADYHMRQSTRWAAVARRCVTFLVSDILTAEDVLAAMTRYAEDEGRDPDSREIDAACAELIRREVEAHRKGIVEAVMDDDEVTANQGRAA